MGSREARILKHLPLLERLKHKERLYMNAAKGGNLEVLQWARAKSCLWDEYTCSMAAWGGHLAVLKWLRVNGCPWDINTFWRAGMGGHLEVVQWARANGCEWAAKLGYVEND